MVRISLQLVALVAGLLIALSLCSRFYRPDSRTSRVLERMLLGLGLLYAWNALPAPQLGVNPLSMLIAGSLGVPGACLLAVLRLL